MALPKKKLPKPSLPLVLNPEGDKRYTHFEHAQQVPFDATATAFSPLNAWWLADAALLAYWPHVEIERRCTAAGFPSAAPIAHQGTQAFVAHNDHAAIVSFRGTEPDQLRDFLTNINAFLDPWVAGGRAHRGFQDALEDVWSQLKPVLKTIGDRPVFFTGHSLGGALATLAADRWLAESGTAPAGVYTIGSPSVGDQAFADGFNQRHHGRSFRFVNDQDGVPALPPSALGYRHVHDARIVGFDDSGVFDFLAEDLIDHTPVRYAILVWNALVDAAAEV